jgi:hypothetical protein
MLHEYHFIYGVQYYPPFHGTAVGFGSTVGLLLFPVYFNQLPVVGIILPVGEIKPLPTSWLKVAFKSTSVPKYVLCSVRKDLFRLISGSLL